MMVCGGMHQNDASEQVKEPSEVAEILEHALTVSKVEGRVFDVEEKDLQTCK